MLKAVKAILQTQKTMIQTTPALKKLTKLENRQLLGIIQLIPCLILYNLLKSVEIIIGFIIQIKNINIELKHSRYQRITNSYRIILKHPLFKYDLLCFF